MKLLSTIQSREFARWALNAKPGDKIEYCIGENVFATINSDKGQARYGALFALVRKSARLGSVALFQQEHHGTTTYIALRVRPGFHAKIKELADAV